MKARRYLHIGCPKAVSTTLQRDFFDAHPAVRHLGVGCGGNLDYRDARLELAFEGHVMFSRELAYREKVEDLRGHLQGHFAAAEADPQVLAVGVSNESFCFGYTPGHVDTADKARRLHDLFGAGTAVILLVRSQPDLLRSLHRESIRNGYAGTLDDFLHYAYLHQDRSFLTDFLFDRTVACYGQLFGAENVHVLPLENYLVGGQLRATDGGHTALADRLAAILGVPAVPMPLGRHNEALSPAVLEAKRRLNAQHPHDLGHPLLGGVVNGHRLRQVYALDLAWDAGTWLHDDVRTKRSLIARAEAEADPSRLLDDRVDPHLKERLLEMFSRSNGRLAQLLSIDLPVSYHKPSF